MKGIDVFLLLFLVDLQRRFGNIDEKYTGEIKGEFAVETINLNIVIRWQKHLGEGCFGNVASAFLYKWWGLGNFFSVVYFDFGLFQFPIIIKMIQMKDQIKEPHARKEKYILNVIKMWSLDESSIINDSLG